VITFLIVEIITEIVLIGFEVREGLLEALPCSIFPVTLFELFFGHFPSPCSTALSHRHEPAKIMTCANSEKKESEV